MRLGKLFLAILTAAMALQAQDNPPPPPPVAASNIPAGTEINVRLGETLSSDKSKAGDRWQGTLQRDVTVDNNILARRGDPVEGTVVAAVPSGRLAGQAELDLAVTSVNGIPVSTDSLNRSGRDHAKRNVAAIGGGAVLGAIIGAAAGGGAGAAIGAGSGAAVGTGGAAATGKKDIKYPVETVLRFYSR
ncbi:MAG TPA: hypothetical protein VKG25_04030 [Bryobacteraceae bacterium]|nr:hypothetical protein [Bryobacteraceae bacterium]